MYSTEIARMLDDRVERLIEAEDDVLAESVYAGVERDAPCVYGHYDCAEYEYGSCANEQFARLVGERKAELRASVEREFAAGVQRRTAGLL